jgi:ribonuclease BN (tRNA processing enzyme)
LKLTVLGCSGPVPRPGQACCGYLLETANARILLDCGSGVLSNLRKHYDFQDIDAVVISHIHADHCFDLLSLRTALRMDMRRPLERPIPVYLPPGATPGLVSVATATGHAPDFFAGALDLREYDPEATLEIGGARFSFAPTKHRIPTYGVRIDSGGVLVYSADSGVCPELQQLATAADLFLCEATFQRETNFPNRPHLKAAETGEIAQAAGVRSLLLTHIWHQLDPRRSVAEASLAYPGPIEAAWEGATYAVDAAEKADSEKAD